MRFKIPGKDINVRLFERVATTDSQYDIFDVGVEQSDGTIDSVVVGGSFSYAKSLVKAIDTKAEEAKAKKAADTKAPEPVVAPVAAPAAPVAAA
jgi:tRNA A37 N6-isopentenylltransferase MiaA